MSPPTSPRIGAIVTGHSRGLGAAIARVLVDRGASVLGVSRSGNSDLAACAPPDRFREAAVDLSDAAALASWLDGGSVREALVGCATVVLINNAGTLQPMGPLARQSPAEVVRAMTLNVTAPLALSAALVRQTPDAADRRILHVSSGAGRNAYAGWSIYGAGKAALDHHARGVAEDAAEGVRISALAPGVIATAMQAEIRASALADFPLRKRFEAMHREGALVDPDDAARRLIDVVMADDFGAEAVADLRG